MPDSPASVRMRAKMFLSELTHTTYGTKVRLNVVTRGEDNKEWSAATPVGHIELTIKNEVAARALTLEHLGTEFFIDITSVPADLVGLEGMDG